MTRQAGTQAESALGDAQARFARMHRAGQPLLLPNAWDVASALLLADAGFPAVGTTSLGVNAAAGLADGAGTGKASTLALARLIVPRLVVPVSIDVEAGYADDPGVVADLAGELAALGAAGINLEDVSGDGLRSLAQQTSIIRAVADAAPGLFVNARTDTYWLGVGPEAGRLAETTRRLLAYQDAGASGVFVPGLTDLRDIETLTSQMRLPLNLLWHPGADIARLSTAGVARISTGSALYRHALAEALALATAARDSSALPGDGGSGLSYQTLLDLLGR
jgi:2-methylisocitrate lyase-like PEP mutase family enzyme